MNTTQIMISLFCLILSASNVFACGGSDLEDDQIKSLAFVQKAQDKISSIYGDVTVIESVVRSGNDLLDLDKNVVARAKCPANYINVFFKGTKLSELRCMTTFELSSHSQTLFSGIREGIACAEKINEKPVWIEL